MTTERTFSRKRSHNEVVGLSESLADSGLAPRPKMMNNNHIESLSLEAIFHPKFENENREQNVRYQMKQKVQLNQGYLEVSLKHSGNLLLWSGGQRYYSKNSTANAFTFVGEVLLRQHLCRSWFDRDNKDDNTGEAMYQRCSDYVEKNRLTLSFEAVTAVLGQHGDIPNKDFLILTAVADKAAQRFYSTVEVLELAQRFRLPHNDVWVYSSLSAVDQLFHLYDTTRETGLADGTIALLDKFGDARVSSMYPHVPFQGNILEGIVIRYVAYKTDEKEHQEKQLEALASGSKEILTKVPPDMPMSFELMNETGSSKVLSVDIRDVYNQCITAGGYANLIPRLGDRILETLNEADSSRRTVDKQSMKEWDIPSIAKHIRVKSNTDEETKRIATLIGKLDELNAAVHYSVYRENNQRWLCIIRILHDRTFMNFQKNMGAGDIHLYRGFSFELGTEGNDVEMAAKNDVPPTAMKTDDAESCDLSLMLKMKFLPYMVRTFCCRNGLKVVKTQGPAGFTSFTAKLMQKWGISQGAQAKWQLFFFAWGQYTHDCMINSAADYIDKSLPPMEEAFYLNHIEHFTPIYERGGIEYKNEIDGGSGDSTYRAMVVVVAIAQATSESAADVISQQLGGVQRLKNINAIKEIDFIKMQAPRGGGMVVSATIPQGFGKLRRFLKDYGESISIVLIGCDDNSIGVSLETNPKKLKGMVKGWKKTRVALVEEIASLSVLEDTDSTQPFQASEEAKKLFASLRKVSEDSAPSTDGRRGLLVFFPCIPGCGKSTLSGPVSERMLLDAMKACQAESDDPDPARKLHILVGDKVKSKYWTQVRKILTRNPSSVFIADKNAPKNAWQMIGEAACGALVVPALPEGVVSTTRLQGVIKSSGDRDQQVGHYYPFSLHYLAICMTRVLARPPGSHIGGLDRSLRQACLVMVKFYTFYRNLSAEGLLDNISAAVQRSGSACSASPIQVPFFTSADLPDLPQDLVTALTEAIQLFYGYELENKVADALIDNDPLVQKVERNLRDTITKNAGFLVAMTVDEDISRRAFVKQIGVCIDENARDSSVDSLPKDPPLEQIKLVSLDVQAANIYEELRRLSAADSSVCQALETMGADTGDGRFLSSDGFVQKTHVTMAFCGRESQKDMRSKFEPLLGQSVTLEVTGLLWNDSSAALAVKVPETSLNGDAVPACSNEFPHITLWFKGVRAVESNRLPQKVKDGEAFEEVFDKPFQIRGTLSFWPQSV